ncbi:MAG: GAF domain-containing protein [Acholeplasmatales bacterium]|jgi:GAF domain-containing protein|nr:GAF domain-containing protein [Acholeplasmataceae bacterium]MDY0115525.1 GAF domain-containing protein [Acholeplasmatales bacterium]MCK9233999.1 GAF domain-containing protein [Acholeplasmataceae bacterium]MCK9289045.1 GAF domain-containing protein [Acholeplasmataceae bacterium]MCK9427740.1 GAF domain-containing protein [Acholeplasmataceae bacterium]
MEKLLKTAQSLFKEAPNNIALLANASAFIMDNFPYLNWVGFYLKSDNYLILGPFQGKVACEKILINEGVCGKAFFNNEVIAVNDVNLFDGHISCDSNSKSELVVPLVKNNHKIGVLDLDSYLFKRFDEETINAVKAIVNALMGSYNFSS